MSTLEAAIRLDIKKQTVETAQKYEEVLKEPDAPLDAFLNLAVLYWDATDPGSFITLDFFAQAAQRYGEVLDAAQERFGPDLRIRFWRRYFAFISLGEPPFAEECVSLIPFCDLPLEIYFHIYDQTANTQYLPQVKQLLADAAQLPIAKNRYIASILNSGIQSYKHNALLSTL